MVISERTIRHFKLYYGFCRGMSPLELEDFTGMNRKNVLMELKAGVRRRPKLWDSALLAEMLEGQYEDGGIVEGGDYEMSTSEVDTIAERNAPSSVYGTSLARKGMGRLRKDSPPRYHPFAQKVAKPKEANINQPPIHHRRNTNNLEVSTNDALQEKYRRMNRDLSGSERKITEYFRQFKPHKV